jgi:pyrroloquinoline quinone biosynthesis protein D
VRELVSLDPTSRPRLTRKARTRIDPLSGRTLLLYPEHGLVLNAPAAAIVARCDGRRIVDIAEELRAPPGEVLAFLARLAERGLVTA